MFFHLHNILRQVQRQTAFNLIAPMPIAKESKSSVQKCCDAHSHVQHTQRLVECVRMAHSILQWKYLPKIID